MAEQFTYGKNLTGLVAIPLPAAITVSGANADIVSAYTPTGGRLKAVSWLVTTGVTTAAATMTVNIDGTDVTTFSVPVTAATNDGYTEFANNTKHALPAGSSKITLTSDGGPDAGVVEFILWVEL